MHSSPGPHPRAPAPPPAPMATRKVDEPQWASSKQRSLCLQCLLHQECRSRRWRQRSPCISSGRPPRSPQPAFSSQRDCFSYWLASYSPPNPLDRALGEEGHTDAHTTCTYPHPVHTPTPHVHAPTVHTPTPPARSSAFPERVSSHVFRWHPLGPPAGKRPHGLAWALPPGLWEEVGNCSSVPPRRARRQERSQPPAHTQAVGIWTLAAAHWPGSSSALLAWPDVR